MFLHRKLNSADALVVTQLIFENKFAGFSAKEIVALLSCFVFQEKKKKKYDNEAIDRNGENFKGRHNITHVKRDNDEEDQSMDDDTYSDESDEDDDERMITINLQKVFMYPSKFRMSELLFMFHIFN